MQRMFGKAGLLSFALLIALGATGIGFAYWTDTVTIAGSVHTGELSWEFVQGSHSQKDPCDPPTKDWNSDHGMTSMWQTDKDVGCTTIGYTDTDADGDYDRLDVTLSDVYPSYYEHIAFVLRNNGTIPLIIDKVIINPGNHVYTSEMLVPVELDLDDDGHEDIEVWYGNNFGQQYDPGHKGVDISFEVHVLEDAPQGECHSFTIEILAIQWNGYGT